MVTTSRFCVLNKNVKKRPFLEEINRFKRLDEELPIGSQRAVSTMADNTRDDRTSKVDFMAGYRLCYY